MCEVGVLPFISNMFLKVILLKQIMHQRTETRVYTVLIKV